MRNFVILEVKIRTKKIANPVEGSQKIFYFLSLLMNDRPLGRPQDSIKANSRFCRVFNDVDFKVVTEAKSIDLKIRYACSFGAPSLPCAFTAPRVTCFYELHTSFSFIFCPTSIVIDSSLIFDPLVTFSQFVLPHFISSFCAHFYFLPPHINPLISS